MIAQALSNGPKSCADPLQTCLSCATPGMSFAGAACSLPDYVRDVRFVGVSQHRLFSNRIRFIFTKPSVWPRPLRRRTYDIVVEDVLRINFPTPCNHDEFDIAHASIVFFGNSTSKQIQVCLIGSRFQLTFGVHEEPSACALRDGNVAQRHGSTYLCHVAT